MGSRDREPRITRMTWRALLGAFVASVAMWMIPCVIIPVVGPPQMNSSYLAAVTWIVEILGPFRPLYAMIFNREPVIYTAHDTLAIQVSSWSAYALFNTVVWFVIALAVVKAVTALRRANVAT